MPAPVQDLDSFSPTTLPPDRSTGYGGRPLLHVGLFLLTVVSTLIAGSLFHAERQVHPWQEVLRNPALWLAGAPYSLSVLAILLAHELGHYLACRYYRVGASLPYFLPGIPILGTFGAFIRIRDRIPHRRALFDIGVAGPLAGFVVALPVFLYGMTHSRVLPLAAVGDTDFFLGFPLLFSLATPLFFRHIPDGSVLSLSPYLSAAWVGMLATSLNLIPAGQLDGGHICYAFSRRFHAAMSRTSLVGVILLGALHRAWLVWAVILLFLGDRHPSLLDEGEPLSPLRRSVALLALLIFLLSFMAVPIQTAP